MEISLSKKVAQKFIVALPYTTNKEELFSIVEKYIEIGVGGIMLGIGGKLPIAETDGKIDIEKLKNITAKLKALDPKLFIAIDGEGGEIFNLFENISNLKPQRYYGLKFEESGSTEEYEKDLDEYIGLMKEVGINMNFAPILDTAKNGYKGYLSEYGRAYSDDEETVKKLSSIAIKKTQENEIIAVGKHFPGYGHIEDNPHTSISKLEHGCEEDKCNLFGNAISNNMQAIMKGHVLSPIDEETPATFSEKTERHLREKLGFEGLSITDEIFMHSLGSSEDRTKTVVEAAKVNDIILMSYPKQKHEDGTVLEVERHDHFERLHSAVVEVIESNEIDEEKINKSFERIVELKTVGQGFAQA